MNNILPSLDRLNYEEIRELRDLLNEKMKDYEDQKIIDDLNNKIKTNGYAWTVKSIDNSKICNENILSVKFPVNIRIYTLDKENTEDIHVDGLSAQNDWIDYLGFDYKPTDNDEWFDSDEWLDNGCWDSPLKGQAVIYVDVYYLKSSAPKEGLHFECFDEYGNIQKWTVLDDKLYCEGEYFGELAGWNEYGLFVLKKD